MCAGSTLPPLSTLWASRPAMYSTAAAPASCATSIAHASSYTLLVARPYFKCQPSEPHTPISSAFDPAFAFYFNGAP